MRTTAESESPAAVCDRELVVLHVGDLLIGVEIHRVEEIRRQAMTTPLPHVAPCVRGVINLRGRVVTVVDLRTVLGMPPEEPTRNTRNVIVRCQGESIGLIVDRVGDVVRVDTERIVAPPANIGETDGRFFEAVARLPDGLVVVLNVDAALDAGSCDV